MSKKWYSICGKPILRSRSPQIHNHWFQTANIDAHYFRLIADNVKAALNTYQKLGVAGFNVTAPFKQAIITVIDELTPEAQATGAVNLVLINGAKLRGFNTDVAGVMDTLATYKCPPDIPTLVIGAGGAARAALYALQQLTTGITITNRTDIKARQLAQEFGCDWQPFADRQSSVLRAHLIVVAVTETEGVLKPEWLASHQVLLDANYIHTRLESVAAEAGCTYLSGKLWLEQQARQVFRHFTSRTPDGALPDLSADLYVNRKNNVALIGFMGAGKTSLGRALAASLGWQFVDTDELIEQASGEKIVDIFNHHGESEFRRREAAMLTKVLSQSQQVIACGGGITIAPENCQQLREHAVVILLYARPAAIWHRLETCFRPLLLTPDYQKRAEQLFSSRLERYLTTADAVIDTEIYPINQARALIHAEIEQLLSN